MHSKPDLIITNIGQLLTVAKANKRPKIFQQMEDLGIIRNAAVAIKDGRFVDVGTSAEIANKYGQSDIETITATGRVALPGFVDSHTHTVFGGDRTHEFIHRIQGEMPLPPMRCRWKERGGIADTVEKTRKSDFQELLMRSQKNLDSMLHHGTTTVEIKSGYGLNLKNELKILKVIHQLKIIHKMDIAPTFLGAHTFPAEYTYDHDAYVNFVCDMLTAVKQYAAFCDVFCDEGAFTALQSKKILNKAKEQGFQLKIHTNEFNDTGGVAVAVELGVISADHLDTVSRHDIEQLAKSKTVCVLLPGVPFFLMRNIYSPAKELIEKGVPIALATDFNPGTCPCLNMQMIITLACFKMHITPAQAINAATINSAHAISMADTIGSIETGKQADMIILDIDDYNQLPYYFGVNHVRTVIKNGRIVIENG